MKRFVYIVLAIFMVFPAHAAQDFNLWLQGVKAEALQAGISQQTIDRALSNISPIGRVIELDRKQPEGRLSFSTYKDRVINQRRIDDGRALYAQHKKLLNAVGAHYGVPPQYIVALWGIETSYGDNTGGFDVVSALATLAHDGRRSSFFRKELISALKILDEGHIDHTKMKGSWAGAMGQNQFMPSSFHSFSVDGNGDGRRDIWTSLPDVFASTANYLSRSGWNEKQRWGRPVQAPHAIPESVTGLDTRKPLSYWRSLGVRLAGGQDLPVDNQIKASLIRPDGINGPAFLVYDNYRVIMKWNKSVYFATSVGLLADQISR